VHLELQRRQQEWLDWRRQDAAAYANFYHDLVNASFQPSAAIEERLKGYIENIDGGKTTTNVCPNFRCQLDCSQMVVW
jgi:hypothetical protein